MDFIPIYEVDSFAMKSFEGNPAAVCLEKFVFLTNIKTN